MKVAKSLWHISPTDSQLQSEQMKSVDADCCLIKTHYSLISTGTERLVACGKVPEELHDSMMVPYMQGQFTFPVKYGYSLVGEVISDSALKGKLVHLLHPHQDFCIVKTKDLFLIPENIPASRATLASNMETVVNAIWDAEVMLGDKILLAGFGLIGSLLALVLKSMNFDNLVVIEKDEQRKALAEKLGFQIESQNKLSKDFDLAFNCTASAKALQTCIDHIGNESRVVELSWFGTASQNLFLGTSFHQQRKQIIASQVSAIPSKQKARWDFKRRKELVFSLLQNSVFDQCIGKSIPFENAPAIFNKIRENKFDNLATIFDYRD